MSPQQNNVRQVERTLGSSEDGLAHPLLEGFEDDYKEDFDITSDDIHDDITKEERTSSSNIRWIMIYTWIMMAGRSVWNANVLATFVYLIRNDNPEAVGIITGMMGMCQVAASLPSAILADKFRRDTMLRVASFFLLVALSMTLLAVYMSSYQYLFLMIALCSWGLYMGLVEPPIQALLAESAAKNSTTKVFTERSLALTLGSVIGPCVALVMFAVLGDKWTITDCSIVIAIGQIICLPAVLLLWLLNDNTTKESTTSSQQQIAGDNTEELTDEGQQDEIDITKIDKLSTLEESRPIVVKSTTCCFCISEQKKIPALIALSDLTFGIASGMSLRYFAIFLFENLTLSPVLVQVIYIVAPLLQAILLKVAQRLAATYGNYHIAVAFKAFGITLMIVMVLSYQHSLPVYLTCTILVFRTGFMNSTRPLTKSILMDKVPKSERAKWASAESLTTFSWSGSAAIGGVLVNYRGILFNFVMTAMLQVLALLPLVYLIMNERKNSDVYAKNKDDDEDDKVYPIFSSDVSTSLCSATVVSSECGSSKFDYPGKFIKVW